MNLNIHISNWHLWSATQARRAVSTVAISCWLAAMIGLVSLAIVQLDDPSYQSARCVVVAAVAGL